MEGLEINILSHQIEIIFQHSQKKTHIINLVCNHEHGKIISRASINLFLIKDMNQHVIQNLRILVLCNGLCNAATTCITMGIVSSTITGINHIRI